MNNLIYEQEFFAPSNFDAIDNLVDEYKRERANIEQVHDFMHGGEMMHAMRYFVDGLKEDRYIPSLDRIFILDTAVAALNAHFWQKALALTDVMDFLPDKRRQEWHKQIKEHETPEFDETTVRATLQSLINQRMDFLAEMVDGIFRGLSGEHVTNRPEGFSRRMIISNVYDCFGYTSYTSRSSLIHDLRGVIAKFMGRDAPTSCATRSDLEGFRKNTGVWHAWDGGALRARVYMKGTAHLEVHPQMAYRLNQILAHLYPAAIPNKYRTQPKRAKTKDFNLFSRPIPFSILAHIRNARYYTSGPHYLPNTLAMGYSGDYDEADKHTKQEVHKILEYIGAAWIDTKKGEYLAGYVFDYNAEGVIEEICASGMLPDYKSHQYYPTPYKLAKKAVELADIHPEHSCLEPQAGQGGLSALMPVDSTKCVEINALHCEVLRAKGYDVEQADFLGWAAGAPKFDRIVMNPPFDQGRAMAHLESARGLLAPGGVLVAILPASYMDKIPGEWIGPFKNEFYNANISVGILKFSAGGPIT